MDIAVIGAGGAVGREIVLQIISSRILDCGQRLILVGNAEGESAKSLFGFAIDIMDAYAETCPQVDVLLEPEKIRADLIIMAAGNTMPVKGAPGGRDMLAKRNLPVFKRYAKAISEHGHGNEIVICISNPNELSVALFSKYLGRKRVVGMGAFLDTLRFRKEIAMDLGIRRQRIHGFVLGEHGIHLVPVWSRLHIYGFDDRKLEDAVARMRRGYDVEAFYDNVKAALEKVIQKIRDGRLYEAMDMIQEYPPDIRTVVRPFVTHFSGAKTIVGTATATVELIRAITSGHDTLVCGQLTLEGEFHDLHGTLGVPYIIGNQGVERVVHIDLSDNEQAALVKSAEIINSKLNRFMAMI